MLLRVLQSKSYRPLGATKDKVADVRIIAATKDVYKRHILHYEKTSVYIPYACSSYWLSWFAYGSRIKRGRDVYKRQLLSGSIGNVILQNPKTEAVTIPMTATVELQDKIIAYRLKNGQAEAAYLTVDRLNDGNRFIVKEGLSVGDTIVAEGVGLLREGMSITPKNETK